MADSPRPNSVSAKPVATWLDKKYCVRIANITDNAAPPIAAQRKPTIGDPVKTAAANPEKAPVIIMPSTPRLRTPDFSTTNSPMAASKIGVAATIKEATRRVGLIALRSMQGSSTLIGQIVYFASVSYADLRFCQFYFEVGQHVERK